MDKMKIERDALEKRISQLKNRQNALMRKEVYEERKFRTHRLIERGAMLESIFPELIPCTNEQIMTFLAKLSRLPYVQELLRASSEDDAG